MTIAQSTTISTRRRQLGRIGAGRATAGYAAASSAAVLTLVMTTAVTTLTGCGASDESLGAAASEGEIRELAANEILGAIKPGQTLTINYTEEPRYRAYSFNAEAKQKVSFTLKSSSPGVDGMLWIARSSDFKTMKNSNLTGSGETELLEYTPELAGQYYIVVREANLEEATFTLSMAAGNKPPPVGQDCEVEDNCGEPTDPSNPGTQNGGKQVDLFADASWTDTGGDLEVVVSSGLKEKLAAIMPDGATSVQLGDWRGVYRERTCNGLGTCTAWVTYAAPAASQSGLPYPNTPGLYGANMNMHSMYDYIGFSQSTATGLNNPSRPITLTLRDSSFGPAFTLKSPTYKLQDDAPPANAHGTSDSVINISENFNKIFVFPGEPSTFWTEDENNYNRRVTGPLKIQIDEGKVGRIRYTQANGKANYTERDLVVYFPVTPGMPINMKAEGETILMSW